MQNKEHERTFSDYSIGAAVCGFGYSASRGTSESKCYEISIGTTCIYEGSVGDIRNEARFYETIDFANNKLRNHLLLAVNLLISDFKKGKFTHEIQLGMIFSLGRHIYL